MDNKILIIGNGFDLYHKLPTRYTDFLYFAKHWGDFKKEYDQQGTGKKSGNQINIRLGDDDELISESLSDFAAYASIYNADHIQFLDKHLRDNAWLEYYFATREHGENSDKKWIDFEAEIEKVLDQTEKYYAELLKLDSGKIGAFYRKYVTPTVLDTVHRFSCLLEKKGSEYKKLTTIDGLHENSLRPEYLINNKKRLLSFLKEELNALNICLDYYLLDFVSQIKPNVYSEQIKALGSVRLLNFNYTHTYNSVYGESDGQQIHYVHGKAEEGNLVLGISDEAFEDNLDYIYFQKYFQRIQKGTGSKYKEWIKEPEDYSNVYIMGHSLSETDQGVLEDVFHANNIKHITIFYSKRYGYEGQVINLVKMFGKDFVIEQTGDRKIEFVELADPVSSNS